MDSDRFDGLSRFMALREARDSRRRVMAAFLGVAAMLPAPLLTVARKKKTRKGCKRKAIKICTGFVCGRRKNNCGKTLKCQCLAGLICLPNGGCGLPCAGGCPGNVAPCTCTTNGEGICLVGDVACASLTTLCQTTADCPEQAACGEVPCGPGGASEKRCVPLCRG